MINVLWLVFLIVGTFVAAITGDIGIVTRTVAEQSEKAVVISFGLIGIMSFWLGIMKLAEKSGLLKTMARLLRPAVGRLFPEIPDDNEALGAIVMNISANMLGLGNAATPLGLKAMEKLQELNGDKTTASNAMCTLLALNTSGLTLVPTTVIGLRIAAGSQNGTAIVGTTIVATLCSTIVAVTVSNLLGRIGRKQ